jgi:hypothetical protein
MARAEKSAAAFEQDALPKWAAANGEAMKKIQAYAAQTDGIHTALMGDRQELVQAAVSAGLPEEKKAEAQRIVDVAWKRMLAADKTAKREQENLGRMPQGPQQQLASMAIMADGQTTMMNAARSIRGDLRQLLEPPQRPKFDDELIRITQR